MADISAQQVKALREQTGCGMMECKKALVETNGDMEKAVVILREKGLATAAKKASRIAAEGTIGIFCDGKTATLVEVNCETDFVAKNDKFQEFANGIAALAASNEFADLNALNAAKLDGDKTVEEVRQELVMVIRENITVRRFTRMEGNVSVYSHGNGKIGVAANFANGIDAQVGKNICMQIAAMNPMYLDAKDVPADVIENEKSIMMAQLQSDPKNANKPAQVIEKIVAGKLSKYYGEFCLLQQEFFLEEGKTVGAYIAEAGNSLQTFVRFERGEGIQKKEDNFADEVASMVK